MKGFEYDITKHAASDFNQLVYFCTDQGECGLDALPQDQFKALQSTLNERGSQGWELVQISFGRDGIVAFWKRDI